ncbi:glycosyltransferase [Vibrio metschnikovii]|nr:glycosyltransferase [Vibrio metschnikovii]
MLSIITVVYNDSDGLEKTIKSLEDQAVSGFSLELILIDGFSECAKIDELSKSFVVSKYISEPDNGIYDAMNKGILFSTGDWVYFLNAGDTLENDNVLLNLLNEIDNTVNVNMIYGSYRADGVLQTQVCTLPFLTTHMINHQSMIYHRSLFEHDYDLRYRFCADYAHLLSVWPRLKPKALDLCIANFDTTGVSSQASNKARMWQERLYAVWRSDLSFTQKLMLSRRGIIALPYHSIKNWLRKDEK